MPAEQWDLEGMLGIKPKPENHETKEEIDDIQPIENKVDNLVEEPPKVEQTDSLETKETDKVNDGNTEDNKISNDPNSEPTENQAEAKEPEPVVEEKPETSEERKKREDQEKREEEIKALEDQIKEREAMLFDWDDLEEAIIKQQYIDGLKQELDYLKNPNKKRKKKKKGAKKNQKVVEIFRPKISKDSIVKNQLMTEKCLKLCNDPDFEVSNIKLDKLQKGMFNRSNN